jgi:hypothetical protein
MKLVQKIGQAKPCDDVATASSRGHYSVN